MIVFETKEKFSKKKHLWEIKAVTKWEEPKHFLATPKMVYFFTAGSWEKAIFGAARNFFGPFYFVTALEDPIGKVCFLVTFHQNSTAETQRQIKGH